MIDFKKRFSDKKGSMTIEMSIIFPLIIYIIIIFVYITMFLYQTANAQSIANKAAQHGSNAWSLENRDIYLGKVNPEDFKDNDPYYRILSSGDEAKKNKITEYAYVKLGQYNVLAKNNTKDKIQKTKGAVKVKIVNNIVTKKIQVTIEQPSILPIGGILKIFGIKQNTFKAKGYAEASINDPSEFIRNTDFTADLIGKSKIGKDIGENVGEFKEKFYSFCTKIGFDFSATEGDEEEDPVDEN